MNNPIREEEVKIYDEIHRANKMKSTPQPEQPKAAFTPVDMLRRVLDRCDDLHSRELMEWDEATTELVNQARAVIARAKGEE